MPDHRASGIRFFACRLPSPTSPFAWFFQSPFLHLVALAPPMPLPLHPLLASLLLAFSAALLPAAETPPASDPTKPAPGSAGAKVRQWVYVLRLVPRLHQDQAWTESDHAIIGRHFAHLQAATKSGQVILAGRTMEPGDKTFGLVIFEAADESAARVFMQSDPSVAEKIMTAELHPYHVALQRK
jgi:uncharacterized protein YciI